MAASTAPWPGSTGHQPPGTDCSPPGKDFLDRRADEYLDASARARRARASESAPAPPRGAGTRRLAADHAQQPNVPLTGAVTGTSAWACRGSNRPCSPPNNSSPSVTGSKRNRATGVRRRGRAGGPSALRAAPAETGEKASNSGPRSRCHSENSSCHAHRRTDVVAAIAWPSADVAYSAAASVAFSSAGWESTRPRVTTATRAGRARGPG